MSRLQDYYDDGVWVYRTGQVDPGSPRKPKGKPTPVCEAVSRRQAQLIAAALNLYVPKEERRAIEREVLRKLDRTRLERVHKSFGLRNSGGGK